MKAEELLQQYQSGERDFTGITFQIHRMHNADLSNAIFNNAVFSECSLRGVNFENSELESISIDANLRRANFRFANLRKAKFCRTFSSVGKPSCDRWLSRSSSLVEADLTGASLNQADLRAADLHDAVLADASLVSADLRSTDLRRANLRNADLTNANLQNADFCHANLKGAVLTGADTIGAKFAGAILPNGTVSRYELLENIKTKLHSFKKIAWKPLVEHRDGGRTASKFAGQPWLDENEEWPTCPHCQEPLDFFLQLNLNDLPSELEGQFGSGLLQFFYCTSETADTHDDAWEAFSTSQFLRVVQLSETESTEVIPQVQIDSSIALVESFFQQPSFQPQLIVGWQKMDDFPNWADAELRGASITREELSRFATDSIFDSPHNLSTFTFMDEVNRLYNEFCQRDSIMTDFIWETALTLAKGDKLAGWPHWVQDVEYPKCPECDRLMDTLVFEFASDDHIPYLWGDVGTGYILQCPDHKEQVAFLWQCG
ncbi:MAG: pentapeptide repeat-containing protein [Cyanobacteria bacterium P01_D01_bin.71]